MPLRRFDRLTEARQASEVVAPGGGEARRGVGHLRRRIAETVERGTETEPVWARMERRRRFVTQDLGVPLADRVLLLSFTPLRLAPLWLTPDRLLTT